MLRVFSAVLGVCLLAAGAMWLGGPADADDDALAKGLSDSTAPLIGASLLGMALSGHEGLADAEKGSLILGETMAATEFLKLVTQVPRPRGHSRDSFPSGHTSAAFALAAILAHDRPELAVPCYAWAAGVGWSRCELHAHRPQEVAAGALLGFGIAQWALHDHRGHSKRAFSQVMCPSHDATFTLGPEPTESGLALVTLAW